MTDSTKHEWFVKRSSAGAATILATSAEDTGGQATRGTRQLDKST